MRGWVNLLKDRIRSNKFVLAYSNKKVVKVHLIPCGIHACIPCGCFRLYYLSKISEEHIHSEIVAMFIFSLLNIARLVWQVWLPW